MKKIIFIIALFLIISPLVAFAASDPKLELIWSTDTYTPFGYQGRNLPVIGSKIIIDPIISNVGGNAKGLKYSWFVEDIFQQNKSGYGRDSFYFYAQQRPGNYHSVKLQVFNDDRTIFVEKTILVPITKPEVVIYSANNTAIEKKSFVAKPYFFSANRLTDLIFEWTLTGQKPISSSDYGASIFNLIITNKQNSSTKVNDLWINVKNSGDDNQKASGFIKVDI